MESKTKTNYKLFSPLKGQSFSLSRLTDKNPNSQIQSMSNVLTIAGRILPMIWKYGLIQVGGNLSIDHCHVEHTKASAFCVHCTYL